MTLIKSISGIRDKTGIRDKIGVNINDNLIPIDAVKFAAAYVMWLKEQFEHENLLVNIG